MKLTDVRERLTDHIATLRDPVGRVGAYRGGRDQAVDLYSSLDVAIMATIMGEELLTTRPSAERQAWGDFINGFQRSDGTYRGLFTHHSRLHAHGMVIGALGSLGMRMRHPHSLYAPLARETDVANWLDQINWAEQWSASHLFWGGMHCYSMSSTCPPTWLDTVVAWLDERLDPDTGWWLNGVEHADRHQGLGGSAHILPLYQHHQREFPAVERLIDSVLAMQLPSGRWLDRPGHYLASYLELDALYVLKFAHDRRPAYRADAITRAVRLYGRLLTRAWQQDAPQLLDQHPHILLGLAGTFGLLHQHLPDEFCDDVGWTDIFSDARLYRTDAVGSFYC